MNRAILGSVIAGIAIMMTVSVIGPAYAASPWKELWKCDNLSTSSDHFGTESFIQVKDGTVGCTEGAFHIECTTNSQHPGKSYFIDRNDDGEFDPESTPKENLRCVKI